MTQPTNLEIVVELWQNLRVAALGSLDEGGFPHVSFVTAVPQQDGTAVLLFSDLARHTFNIKRDSRVSLLVTERQMAGDGSNVEPNEDPLTKERITLHGVIEICPDHQLEGAKASYLKYHPASSLYVDFADFNFYKFVPGKIFLVGGFGRIETLSANVFK